MYMDRHIWHQIGIVKDWKQLFRTMPNDQEIDLISDEISPKEYHVTL